jgi:hypothetical protein
MASSVYRSHRARVKDAVELFTDSYLATPVWLLTARLQKIKDTTAVLDMVNSDFPELENRINLLENRDWCINHTNVLQNAIRSRVIDYGDISNFSIPSTDPAIPNFCEDEVYDSRIRQIHVDYLKDLDDGVPESHAELKKISAERIALREYKPTAAAETRDWRPPLRFRTMLASTMRKTGSFPTGTPLSADNSSSSANTDGRPPKRTAIMPIASVQAGNSSTVEDDSPLSDQPQSPDGPPTVQSSSSSSSSSAGTYQAVETLLALPNVGQQNDNRQSVEDRRY